MSVVARRIIVRGRVQGVGFRAFVEEEAQARALSGFVRNRRDGSVEAVFSGPTEAVDAAIAACRRGPAAARVDAVEINDIGENELALSGAELRFIVLATH